MKQKIPILERASENLLLRKKLIKRPQFLDNSFNKLCQITSTFMLRKEFRLGCGQGKQLSLKKSPGGISK